jgi:hypothetical protein
MLQCFSKRTAMLHNDSKQKPIRLLAIPEELLYDINSKLDKLLEKANSRGDSPQLRDWISEKEAQQLLGKKNTALWTLRKEGKLKFTKVGGKTFYDLKSLIHLLDSGVKI